MWCFSLWGGGGCFSHHAQWWGATNNMIIIEREALGIVFVILLMDNSPLQQSSGPIQAFHPYQPVRCKDGPCSRSLSCMEMQTASLSYPYPWIMVGCQRPTFSTSSKWRKLLLFLLKWDGTPGMTRCIQQDLVIYRRYGGLPELKLYITRRSV